MKKIIVALLVTGFLAIASLAMAQGWGKGPGCRMGLGPSADVYGPMGPGAGLNLTAEQIQRCSPPGKLFQRDDAAEK